MGFEICSEGHIEIVFDSKRTIYSPGVKCPLCESRKEIEAHGKAESELIENVERLKEQIAELTKAICAVADDMVCESKKECGIEFDFYICRLRMLGTPKAPEMK
jgi:DNA repair exonuclease SbcCD ATPase subunit